MRRKLSLLAFFILLIAFLSSCNVMQKDCRGRRHYKLENGIYL